MSKVTSADNDMGIDQGFDLWPPLTESTEDKAKWAAFLDEVKNKYENDENVAIKMDSRIAIEILQGEHPRLLKNGHQFRRFSSKITGSHAKNVVQYLDEVTEIAIRHFGWRRRIHPWNELDVDYLEKMRYNWKEVFEGEG